MFWIRETYVEMSSVLPFIPKSIQKEYEENENLEYSFTCIGGWIIYDKNYSLLSRWHYQWPKFLQLKNSDKSGNTNILRTTLYGLIMSDYYRSKLSMNEKNIDTNTSHHIVKVYCDAVHGLPFHIGTIGKADW